MHSEWGELPASTADAITVCRSRKGRVVAVGTTSVRVLETWAKQPGGAWSGESDLFIRPPYRFQMVHGLITNFHLPKTSLLLLVQAFAGVELVRRAYQEAIELGYRFYSYGDAMLILPEMMSALTWSSCDFRSAGTLPSKSWNGARPVPSFSSVPT